MASDGGPGKHGGGFWLAPVGGGRVAYTLVMSGSLLFAQVAAILTALANAALSLGLAYSLEKTGGQKLRLERIRNVLVILIAAQVLLNGSAELLWRLFRTKVESSKLDTHLQLAAFGPKLLP